MNTSANHAGKGFHFFKKSAQRKKIQIVRNASPKKSRNSCLRSAAPVLRPAFLRRVLLMALEAVAEAFLHAEPCAQRIA